MYNHTGAQGRLTATPELRCTPSGTAITSFTLASDTGRKTKYGNRCKANEITVRNINFSDNQQTASGQRSAEEGPQKSRRQSRPDNSRDGTTPLPL